MNLLQLVKLLIELLLYVSSAWLYVCQTQLMCILNFLFLIVVIFQLVIWLLIHVP